MRLSDRDSRGREVDGFTKRPQKRPHEKVANPSVVTIQLAHYSSRTRSICTRASRRPDSPKKARMPATRCSERSVKYRLTWLQALRRVRHLLHGSSRSIACVDPKLGDASASTMRTHVCP